MLATVAVVIQLLHHNGACGDGLQFVPVPVVGRHCALGKSVRQHEQLIKNRTHVNLLRDLAVLEKSELMSAVGQEDFHGAPGCGWLLRLGKDVIAHGVAPDVPSEVRVNVLFLVDNLRHVPLACLPVVGVHPPGDRL